MGQILALVNVPLPDFLGKGIIALQVLASGVGKQSSTTFNPAVALQPKSFPEESIEGQAVKDMVLSLLLEILEDPSERAFFQGYLPF